jgi:hypothetical protein
MAALASAEEDDEPETALGDHDQFIGDLMRSGPAPAEFADEVIATAQAWRSNATISKDAAVHVDEFRCFARGCFARARAANAESFSRFSQALGQHAPLSAMRASSALMPPARTEDGELQTVWYVAPPGTHP